MGDGDMSVKHVITSQENNLATWDGDNFFNLELKGKEGTNQNGAFAAYMITIDDFAKKGYASPPNMMEGGSVWT